MMNLISLIGSQPSNIFSLSFVMGVHMMDGTNTVFSFKPSLRRGYFLGLLYAGLMSYGRYATHTQESLFQIWLAVFAVLLVALAYGILRQATTDYMVNDIGVSVTWGILARDTSSVPYGRITNAASRQTILDRILGLTNVFFDTAGGPGPEVVFKRITNSEAKRLIAYLRDFAQKSTATEAYGLRPAQASGI